MANEKVISPQALIDKFKEALAVGWIFGAMMVYIILGGEENDDHYS